jgi:hypothetical protein
MSGGAHHPSKNAHLPERERTKPERWRSPVLILSIIFSVLFFSIPVGVFSNES